MVDLRKDFNPYRSFLEIAMEDTRKAFEGSAYTFSYSMDDRHRVSVSVHERGKDVPLCGMVSGDIADVVQWLMRHVK